MASGDECTEGRKGYIIHEKSGTNCNFDKSVALVLKGQGMCADLFMIVYASERFVSMADQLGATQIFLRIPTSRRLTTTFLLHLALHRQNFTSISSVARTLVARTFLVQKLNNF